MREHRLNGFTPPREYFNFLMKADELRLTNAIVDRDTDEIEDLLQEYYEAGMDYFTAVVKEANQTFYDEKIIGKDGSC